MSLKQQQHQTLPNPEVGGVGSASAMEKLLEAQQQQLDDITSESSFLEFLRNEQNCLTTGVSNGNGSGGCAEEVDVDRIFEQVSQLAGAGEDGKSVEEILREAEQLIRKQHPLFGGNGAKEEDGGAYDGMREVQRAMCGLRGISCESTPMEMRTGVLEELEAIARREEESKAFAKVSTFTFEYFI